MVYIVFLLYCISMYWLFCSYFVFCFLLFCYVLGNRYTYIYEHRYSYVMVKFTGVAWDVGSSHVVTIPAQYIKDGQLKAGVEYNITIEKKEE